MQVGFTADETTDLFNNLKAEVFEFFGHEHPLSFGVRPFDSGIFTAETIAHCNFSTTPDMPYTPGVTQLTEVAAAIRVCDRYLPFLYEDELVHILLHELVHATLPLSAQHGGTWQRRTEQVGGIPLDYFVIRNYMEMYDGIGRNDQLAVAFAKMMGPTMEVYTSYPKPRPRNEIILNGGWTMTISEDYATNWGWR